ncbi:MAG: hypothetical protein J5J06_01495 [Phycisphaerae bacterium]|nr:hypothetical protein [Phycisphaerae bacterium]
MKRLGSTLLLSLVVAAGGFGLMALRAEARPQPCPQIYAPVICDNGKIYPNQCEADRHHAKNCVPYPWI